MRIASRSLVAATADVLRAHLAVLTRSIVLLAGLLLPLVPATARADLYKWTDEQGSTVISNVRPANPQKVRNFEVVLKETERAPTRSEQVLLDRIDNLERQLRTQQSPPPAPPPYAAYNEGYYAAQPAYSPPPPPSYYNDYYPGYYPWLPSYSYIFPGRSFFHRPRSVFAHNRVVAVRGSGMHRGRR
ncbi:MAG TPA: DUF4124 domain-containing protein [Burkholderiales bacterium]|nr:DUF4124 domain-containing protein [Burkholderiales bacterium]